MATRISLGSGAAALGAAFGGGDTLRKKAFNQRMQQLGQLFADKARGRKDILEGDVTQRQIGALDQAASNFKALGYTDQQAAILGSLLNANKGADPNNVIEAALRGMIPVAGTEAVPQGENPMLHALGEATTKVADGVAFNPYSTPEKNLFTPTKPLKSGYVYDPNTRTASEVPIVGAGEPSGARTIPGADGHDVTFDFAPGTPPEVIAAAKAAAVANGDIQAPGAAQPDFMATQDPQGLLASGNIDLSARPTVHNPDGSISTVRSITITDGQGRAILIPTVVGNRVVSDQEAVDHYRKTGQNLGVFDNETDADAYAQQLHEQQAREYLPSGIMAPTGKTLADVTASKSSPGKIQQRQQELQQLASRGVNLDDTQRQQYLVTGKLPANFQGSSDVQALGNISLNGTQYLQSIPDSERGVVKGLLNGTVELPRGTALKNGFWQSALASVKHADPSWNQGAYKQYVNTRKFFTIGQGGQLINSINTAAQHLDKLREDIEAMHNGDNRYLAAAGNYLGSHFGGDQAPTNFMADLTPVASELAAVYKGKGVPSDAEIAHFQNALSQNMSYGQQMNVIRGWIDLLAGKLNATRSQYQQSMTKLSDPLDVINPRAKDALERITHLANTVSNTGQHPMPQMSQTPINAPGGVPQPPAAPSEQGGDNIDAVLQSLGVQ